MIAKTFASAFALGFCALATSYAPVQSAIPSRRPVAQAVELQPILEPSDSVIARSGPARFAPFPAPAASACSDSIANCSDPVKHLGTQNDCACFACAYGTASQRTVCTRNPADKDALFKRAK